MEPWSVELLSISHSFSQLQGNAFKNASLKGQRLDSARQDILFRLDKVGVELKSSARVATTGVATHYYCNRPFLVDLKKRATLAPYFAAWVNNAELLSRLHEVEVAEGN